MAASRGAVLPDPVESRIWGNLAASNANDLLESARRLASRDRLGHAIGLCVLSVEEAVKARMLFGRARQGDKFSLDENTVRRILRGDHRLRHFVGWLQGSTSEARALLAPEGPGEVPAELESRFQALEWLMVANESKNGGFYVDYLGDGHWSTPQAATPEQWAMALDVAEPFVREALAQADRNLKDLDEAGPHPLRSRGSPDQEAS